MKSITLQEFKKLKKELQSKVQVSRGDIWMVNIPEEVRETLGKNIQTGIRPCVIISGEGNNRHSNIINILPISSRIHKVYPQHTEITTYEDIKACGLTEPSIVLGEQYLTVGKERLMEKKGKAPRRLMEDIDSKQEIQQGLNSKAYFNWKEVFQTIKMMLKVRDTDAEVCYFLYKQITEYCSKYNMNVDEVINEYHKSLINNKKKINLYENRHHVDTRVRKNLNVCIPNYCVAQA